jgi:hypothetical protein
MTEGKIRPRLFGGKDFFSESLRSVSRHEMLGQPAA